MRTKQELLFGKQAVAQKFINREQLKRCIQLQEEKNIPLAEIFLQEKLLDNAKLEILFRKHLKKTYRENTRDKGEDLVLLRLLLKQQVVTQDVLKMLLESLNTSDAYSFGELILKKQKVPILEFAKIYSNLAEETLSCSGCEKEFRLINLNPGKKVRCKYCKSIIVVPTLEQELAVYQSNEEVIPKTPESETFAGYDILEEVAQGGMGIIYKVTKKATGQIVALKVLREAHRTSPEAKKRFEREAKTLSKLKHINIVSVLDVGIETETPYFTMDFVNGKAIDELIKGGELSITESIRLMLEICEGLKYAHDMGVIHRDIKPSNILVDEKGVPRITDFGLAKSMDSVTLVTRSGTMLGTPYYMAPEQAKGQLGLVGVRSDIYSLGVVFYEMLVGQNPFTGENTVEIYQNILTLEPTPPSELNALIPKTLDPICLKCLKKDPFQRYKNITDLIADLKSMQEGKKGLWSFFRKLFGR